MKWFQTATPAQESKRTKIIRKQGISPPIREGEIVPIRIRNTGVQRRTSLTERAKDRNAGNGSVKKDEPPSFADATAVPKGRIRKQVLTTPSRTQHLEFHKTQASSGLNDNSHFVRRSTRRHVRTTSPNEEKPVATQEHENEAQNISSTCDKVWLRVPRKQQAHPVKFSKEQFDEIHEQVRSTISRNCTKNIHGRYQILNELAGMAIKLDISSMDLDSADVPGIFTHYFQKLCMGMTEDDEEYIIAQKGGAESGPNLVERLQSLTGRNKLDENIWTSLEAVHGKGNTPWTGFSSLQDQLDDGQLFFNCENYNPQIQATLDRMALGYADEGQDCLADLVDIIDSISARCKRRTLFQTQQSAFMALMYIIKATERCIRYKGERWLFSSTVDFAQLAILKLLNPDTMKAEIREQWRTDVSLLNWLYIMGRQDSWHLPKMARVIDQFHGPDDIFACRRTWSTVHPLPAQERL